MARGNPRPYNQRLYKRNRAILLQGRPRCALRIRCGGAPATTADHVIPLDLGGTNALANLQPACLSCNSAKKNRRRLQEGASW